MENLQNKNVVIVGATGGIGHALTKLVKSSRANVYVTGRDSSVLNALAVDLSIPSDQVFVLDITNYQEVLATAEKINKAAGEQGVDIMVNATGVGIIKPLEDMSFEDFSHSLDVNLKGAFSLLKGFVPAMKARKRGLIINLPGVLGKTPMAGASAYAASKYGLNGMLKSVREELKRTEVRITNLYLGGTDTAFWDTIDMRVQKEKFVTAEEAAKSIWFLCQQPTSGVVSEMVLQPFNHQAI